MTYSIRLPTDIEDRLERLSHQTGRSKSFYVREAILEHLNDIEDIYIAEKRLETIRSDALEALPLEEIMKKYDMDC